MVSEATYLRGELIRAKGLLAEAEGMLEAAQSCGDIFGKLDCVASLRARLAEFRQRPVAVLPPGVRGEEYDNG